MKKETFINLIHKPHLLNHNTLEGLKKVVEEYPHFHAAWLLYLKNLKQINHPEFDAALKKAAPLLPDRKLLYWFLHSEDAPAVFSFGLDNAGTGSGSYALETPESSTAGNKLIDKFLSASTGSLKLDKPYQENATPAADNDLIAKSLIESDELVTETLANIYLEQKKYDKALDAFKKLSLKYPEKNSYFATRIEEIIKLKNI